METIFKAAMNHIHAKESTKRKTEEYLRQNLAGSPAVNSGRTRTPFTKRTVTAACAVIFVCAISVGAVIYYKTPTSYLSLDINPSVELGVNTFGKVVLATAYNNDGKTILSGQKLMDTDVKSAVHTLVKTAAQKGFVEKDGSTVIAVTSETDDGATAAALEEAAVQGADSAVKSEGKTATIEKENVSLDKRVEAQKLDITPGKLNLIQKLQALDPSITVKEYKDSKVTDIVNKLAELKESNPGNPGDGSGDPSPANEDLQDAGNKTAGGDTQDAAGEAIGGDPQDAPKETVGENSQATPDETVSEENSSGEPAKENSETASEKEGTSSQPRSQTGSSQAAQSGGTKDDTASGTASQSPNSTAGTADK